MSSAHFITPLRVEVLPNGLKQLLEPLKFYSADLRGVLVVPLGTLTDFASTPRFSWIWFPQDGRWSAAACLHDAAYRAQLETEDGQRVHLIKVLADRLFNEAMNALGVGWLARRIMYRAVVLWGGRPYYGLGEPVPRPVGAIAVVNQLPHAHA
jgi:hypothetical protein